MREEIHEGYRNEDYIRKHTERIKRLKRLRKKNPILLQMPLSWNPGDDIS